MEVFGQDMKIGDFVLSEHGFMLGSFNYSGDSEDDLGLNHETEEVYTDYHAVPLFISAQYSKKLEFEITIIKHCPVGYFTEYEIRDVLRHLTGMPYYQWSQLLTDNPEENLYYFCRTTSAAFQKISGRVVGIILTMECDSPYAWSREYTYSYDIESDKTLVFYNNSDEFYDDYYPLVKITPNDTIEKLTITNITDNNREIVLLNISANETITMDSAKQMLSTTDEDKLLFINDNFNFNWISFAPGRNELHFDQAVHVEFICRFPRKVGI